jgi:hypothetical protein
MPHHINILKVLSMNNLLNPLSEPYSFGDVLLYKEVAVWYKKRKEGFYMKMGTEEQEVREENRKMRYLRFLVDFSVLSIQQDDLLLEDALKLVEDVKRAACGLFPGKEETFELIYRPRFSRVIQERFGIE